MSGSKSLISGSTLCLILGLLGLSAALICKQCNVNCESAGDEVCLDTGEEQEVACLTEIFKDSNNTVLYQRKCVLYEKGTKYECANYPGYTSIACVTCKTDRCNASPSGEFVEIIRANKTTSNSTLNTLLNKVLYTV